MSTLSQNDPRSAAAGLPQRCDTVAMQLPCCCSVDRYIYGSTNSTGIRQSRTFAVGTTDFDDQSGRGDQGGKISEFGGVWTNNSLSF